jgi:hypothetical protein
MSPYQGRIDEVMSSLRAMPNECHHMIAYLARLLYLLSDAAVAYRRHANTDRKCPYLVSLAEAELGRAQEALYKFEAP